MKSVRLAPASVTETSTYPCEHPVDSAPTETLSFCYTNANDTFRSGLWEMTVSGVVGRVLAGPHAPFVRRASSPS